MNRNELIARREDLEAMMHDIAQQVAAADAKTQGDRMDILIDAYQAARARLKVIEAKLGE